MVDTNNEDSKYGFQSKNVLYSVFLRANQSCGMPSLRALRTQNGIMIQDKFGFSHSAVEPYDIETQYHATPKT